MLVYLLYICSQKSILCLAKMYSMAVDKFFSLGALTFTTYQARWNQNCVGLAFVPILVARCLQLG